ncbi:MAG: hypothetical protein OHK0013_18170 [Sandaracinaceae bacterium]
MSPFRPAKRPLDRARVALIFSPGSIGVDYAAALVRGPERALAELGAIVDTMTTAHHREDIEAFYARRPVLGRDVFGPGSSLHDGLLSFLSEAPPGGYDFVLGYFYDVMLAPSVCEALRRSARRLINFPLNLFDQTDHFARALTFFDETWCAEEGVLDELRATPGLENKIRYVPMASDPFLFRPLGQPSEPRILFAGSSYGRRGELLARFGREVPVTITGAGHGPLGTLRALAREVIKDRRRIPMREVAARVRRSLNVGVPIGDEAYARLAATHGLSVGFNDVRRERTGKTVYKVRLREYDAAMTGLCHLAQRLPELERGFVDGREMLLYDDEEEAVELLRRIARGDIDWRAIGRDARRRAEVDHTWTRRFYDVFA